MRPKVYGPDTNLGWGLRSWIEMFHTLHAHRSMTWMMFRRNFMARYKQTLLGMGGAFMEPVFVVSSYIILDVIGVWDAGDTGVAFAVYAFMGQALWGIVTSGINACSVAIPAGGSLVGKINFPRETLVIAQLAQVIVDVLIRLIIASAVFICCKTVPAWTTIFFPFAILPLMMFTLGIGLLLAFINELIRDIGHYVTISLPFFFFLTPIMYAPPEHEWMQKIIAFNPFAGLVLPPRDLVLYGHISNPYQFIWASILSVVLLLVSWRMFHISQVRLTERTGGR